MFNKNQSLYDNEGSKVIRLEVILSPTIVAESRKDVSVDIKNSRKDAKTFPKFFCNSVIL